MKVAKINIGQYLKRMSEQYVTEADSAKTDYNYPEMVRLR